MSSRTERKARRRIPAADRRAAILAAALDVFSERGFNEASLDDVAARDGVSKALIYEHFASKDELVDELVATYGGQLLGDATKALASSGPGEERLRAGLSAFLRFVEERPAGWRLIARNASHPDVAAGFQRLHNLATQVAAAMIAEDAPPQRSREPDFATDSEGLAHQIVGAIEALATWWVDHPEVSRERVLGMAMDFAWVGLDGLSRGRRWHAGSSGI